MAATVRLGIAKRMRKEVTNCCHTNIGILDMRMPGARMFRIVVTKFSEPTVEPTPVIKMPSTQKSIPCDCEYCAEVSGAYANQPASGAPPSRKEL